MWLKDMLDKVQPFKHYSVNLFKKKSKFLIACKRRAPFQPKWPDSIFFFYLSRNYAWQVKAW